MEVPNWLVPAAAAVIAAIITSFVTWRLAKQKASLELNDKRFRLYETVKNCVDQFSINTQRFDSEQEIKFLKAKDEARLYFDDELQDYLETLRKNILIVCAIDKQIAHLQEQKRINSLAKLGAKRDQAMNFIQKFYEVGQSKFTNSRPRSLGSKLVKFFRPRDA
jgi:hypothetical protein